MLPVINALVTAICFSCERRDKGLHKCVKFHRTNMMIDAWSGSHYVERLTHEQMHKAWAHIITLRKFTRGLLKMTRPLLLVISEPGLAALRGGKAAPPRPYPGGAWACKRPKV
jgi:hypothetical protein